MYKEVVQRISFGLLAELEISALEPTFTELEKQLQKEFKMDNFNLSLKCLESVKMVDSIFNPGDFLKEYRSARQDCKMTAKTHEVLSEKDLVNILLQGLNFHYAELLTEKNKVIRRSGYKTLKAIDLSLEIEFFYLDTAKGTNDMPLWYVAKAKPSFQFKANQAATADKMKREDRLCTTCKTAGKWIT